MVGGNNECPALKCHNLTMRFGGLVALRGLSLKANGGSIHGIIGPNGAGKTTLFNVVSGIYSPTAGSIELFGREITGLQPHVIARLGVNRTFQNIRLFHSMTVMDNVLVGQHLRRKASLTEALLTSSRYKREEKEMSKVTMDLLIMVGLDKVANHYAGALPYGQQRRLEIARALATQPKVLLLDEPAAGMNTAEVTELVKLVQQINERFHLTILLIEHQMRVVMRVCEHITVIDHGEVIAEGTPQEIQTNPRVIQAYLGGSYSAGG